MRREVIEVSLVEFEVQSSSRAPCRRCRFGPLRAQAAQNRSHAREVQLD